MREQVPDRDDALVARAELREVVRDRRVQPDAAALDQQRQKHPRYQRLRQRREVEDGVECGRVPFGVAHGFAQSVGEAYAATLRDEVDGGREVARLDALGEHVGDCFFA